MIQQTIRKIIENRSQKRGQGGGEGRTSWERVPPDTIKTRRSTKRLRAFSTNVLSRNNKNTSSSFSEPLSVYIIYHKYYILGVSYMNILYLHQPSLEDTGNTNHLIKTVSQRFFKEGKWQLLQPLGLLLCFRASHTEYFIAFKRLCMDLFTTHIVIYACTWNLILIRMYMLPYIPNPICIRA